MRTTPASSTPPLQPVDSPVSAARLRRWPPETLVSIVRGEAFSDATGVKREPTALEQRFIPVMN